MHAFVQLMLKWYFGILETFGLPGVVVLMAMERSIFPVPSELVVPPAAYLESHAKGGAFILTLSVILAATVGSFIGAAATYWLSRVIGRPLIVRYGKYLLIPEGKLKLAERWVGRYGPAGVFIASLLPVVRHIISIPAGIAGMRFRNFAIMTFLGSAVWCTILTVFGLMMASDMEILIQGGSETVGYRQAFKNLTWATTGLVVVVSVAYLLVIRHSHRSSKEPNTDSLPV